VAVYTRLYNSALIAARGGLTAKAFYDYMHELGLAARESEARAVYKIARAAVASSRDEIFRPLNQVPKPGVNDTWPTRKTAGIAQTVTLVYRDRTTGVRKQTYYRVITENGITREEAIAKAINTYSEHAEDYDQDLEAALHTSSLRMVPEDQL
jgi:hypothetical protein